MKSFQCSNIDKSNNLRRAMLKKLSLDRIEYVEKKKNNY